MGFASFFEDIMFRAAENGVDLGAAIPTYDPFREVDASEGADASQSTRAKPKTIRLRGEEARLYFLQHFAGARSFAYLHVVEAKTGRLLHEFPYRLLAEVKAKLAEVEEKHPGLLRLVIAKRLEIPQEGKRHFLAAYVMGMATSGDFTVIIREAK
jgi:hypothetical protein